MHTLGSEERALLLAVLDVRATRCAPWTDELDWRSVIAAARAGKIVATLAHRVVSERFAVPDAALSDGLREALLDSAAHNARLQAELARCASELTAAGVRHVALKGSVLMARHYPHLAMRHAVDVDVLVDPDRFERGRDALLSAGYEVAPYTASLTFDGGTFARSLEAPHWHACAPLQSPSGVVVDVHRRVPTSDFESSGGFAGWLARATPHVLHGATVNLCGREDLAVHLCEHFGVQGHGDPAEVPRLLCDLRVLYADEPPWERLRHGSARRMLAVALIQQLYTAAFVQPARHDAVGRLLRRVAVADPAVTPPLARLSAVAGYVTRLSTDVVERPRFAARKLFPARAYVAQRYGLDPRSPLLYARYLSRLLSVARGPRDPRP